VIDLVIVRRGVYFDSVALMLASRAASSSDGARDVSVVMATPLNLGLLEGLGFDLEPAGSLTVSDLVIAVRAEDQACADRVVLAIDEALSVGSPVGGGPAGEAAPVSVGAAARRQPELSLALVSVPGRHAAYEAAAALEAGLHVFCFSDGVGLESERALKDRAHASGLLFMGPDCGTAIIDGVGLGFANAVARGPVGIVGASGTGIQEVCSLLDLAGVGISHAIGVGGRDLSSEIGGRMMLDGLALLADDPETEVIVVISKPPDPSVAALVTEAAAATGKPTVVAFLGSGVLVDRLEAAADRAAGLVGSRLPTGSPELGRPRTPGFIRGLFSGGTLCLEAMLVVAPTTERVTSNVPLRRDWRVSDVHDSDRHTFIDFGVDDLTDGRAHPMIDPTLRLERLAREAADPQVSVIMLDIVLGFGAHPDPASEFGPAIARALAGRKGLTLIVALCGTDGDPQGLDAQRSRLEASGAVVVRGAGAAARVAVQVAVGSEVARHD
jgi:FdrA protein